MESNPLNNTILRGFNPDPSIIRVKDDYYIATSTFEWFPGIQIHHSKDLNNWKLILRPLNRQSQLDMKGNIDSGGVWAPCLSYDSGVFYLVYSNVRSFSSQLVDLENYLVTADNIMGPWSDPIYLNSSGFDASLFHDDDGKKWLVNMMLDPRRRKFFGGIILQEFNMEAGKLVGPVHHIFQGTELGCTEAPHLYKREGFYYLITAEGGTEYGHAVTIARSRKITGPYEIHPENPIITSKDDPGAPLQKAGHADLVETQNGEWYSAFLVGRPLSSRGRCLLGRETAIEKMTWGEDGWLYSESRSRIPRLEVPGLDVPSSKGETIDIKDDFDTPDLNINLQSLRIPVSEDWLSLSERPGYLRLKGRESLSSLHNQSLIARRVQHFNIRVMTCMEFQPENFQQMAGLVCYYNTRHYHYLYLTSNEENTQRLLNIISFDKWDAVDIMEQPIDLTGTARIFLKADLDRDYLQFYYGVEDGDWKKIGPVLDASILSDDYVMYDNDRYQPAFTGAFVGLCCQDLSGHRAHADFDWFVYEEH